MIQIRFVKLRCEAARLKHVVLFALLLGACLLTVRYQKRSEASETETPAATSTGGVVEVENGGSQVDPRQSGYAHLENTDSAEVQPSSTLTPVTEETNGDSMITKVYQLKHGRAQNFGNTLFNMFNTRKMPAEVINSVDERTNSLLVRTTPQRHEEIEQLLKILDVPIEDDASAESTNNKSRNKIYRDQSETQIALEKQIQELSAKLKQLSETVDPQEPTSGDHQADQLATQLKDAVEKSFNERQRQQLAEIERLTTRLNRLAESIQQREAEREQIISRKIDELLGKSSTKTSTNLFTPEELQWITARSMKLLYFHAPDSERCRKMKPELESLAAEGVPVEFISYTVDNKLAKQFGVTSVPTVVMMVSGGMDGQWTGFLDREQLKRRIRYIIHGRYFLFPMMSESPGFQLVQPSVFQLVQPGILGSEANVLRWSQSAGDGTSEASSLLPAEEKGDAIRLPSGTELETSRRNSVSWDELQSIQEALSASRSVVSGVRENIKDIQTRLDIFRQPFSNWDSVVRDQFQKEFNDVRSNLRPSSHYNYRGKKFSEDIARLIWEDRRKYADNKVINDEQTFESPGSTENPEPNVLTPTTDQMLDDVRADLVRMCEERLAMYQSDEQRSLKQWKSKWDSYKVRTQIFQLDVEAAEASLNFLTGKLERTEAHQSHGLIGPEEVEKTTAERKLAEIQLEKARELLKLYTAIESNNPELNPEYGDESSSAEGAAE